MVAERQVVNREKFNTAAALPFGLRALDFESAMQDVYDFFYNVNVLLLGKGLHRLDDMLRKQTMSGLLSDMLTDSMAKHATSLVRNEYHNGHPDLVLRGIYPSNSIKAGDQGVEIKTTLKAGGAVDTHGGRDQWMCVFVYVTDRTTEPAINRRSMKFTEVYLGQVVVADFRNNARGALGTKTSTLSAAGIAKLRSSWVYLDRESTAVPAALA